MNVRTCTPRLLAAGLSVFAAVSLAGCSTISSPPALTIAYTATSNEGAPTVNTEPITDLVTTHAADSLFPGDGKVTIVGPDTTTVVDLTPMRGDEVEASPDKITEQIALHWATLDKKVTATNATSDGLDVIGVLDRALEATKTGGTVVMVTSGFSTIDPVDLNAAGDWIANPTGFVDLVDHADLPDATGKKVVFAGLGYASATGTQDDAGPAARSSLTTIMLGLCQKMSATTCTTLTGAAGTQDPTAINPVTAVSLDQIITHCVGQVTIDASIAFAPKSYVLLDTVNAILAPIAESLGRCPGGSVLDGTGHSAAVLSEGPGAGTALEKLRAQAVLNRLIELGAPTTRIGAASAGGQLIDNNPGGVYNENLAIKNRVVVLSITP